jgi:hypothetical protein
MLLPVSNVEVENCLRVILMHEGYLLSTQRSLGQAGVDILAIREGERYHIEAIGYKAAGSMRAKDFYESFFRVVSSLTSGTTIDSYSSRSLPQFAV